MTFITLFFYIHSQDRRGTIENIAEFLGKDLTKEQVDKIVDYTSIESMKNNKACNLLYFEEMFKTDTSEGAFINKGAMCYPYNLHC